MVLLTIHVRPQGGYSYPGRIRTITTDSSTRLEEVIATLKLDVKKGINMYRDGTELALNSSLASINVQTGDVLETCSSPLLAAVLSSLLQDFSAIQDLLTADERTKENIEPLLGLESHDEQQPLLDPWPDRWDHESLKTRVICLAYLKKVLQRQDRFANLEIPKMTSLPQLYDFLQASVFSKDRNKNGRQYNSMANIVKPSNKDGVPTTCWKLLEFKLDRINFLAASSTAGLSTSRTQTIQCCIENFLKSERERHATIQAIHGVSSPQQGSITNDTPNTTNTRNSRRGNSESTRKRRRLNVESPSIRLNAREWKCTTCKTARADSLCLTGHCPFGKQPSCKNCFSANHPILQRDHECVDFSDARAKALLKSLHKQDKQDSYCPDYASGPFAILCTLYEQMMTKSQLSLPESRLKELAQPICRSNLYDHQARGRNAFACVELLTHRELVRQERLPGANRMEQEGKYSLLPDGESLAKYCFAFEQQVQAVIGTNPKESRDRNMALGGNSSSSNNNPLTILVDTREDRTFAERLQRRCHTERIPCEARELPAGDYLFLSGDNKVCPVVIERKSWTDLADSVLGKGQRRLDCVRIGGDNGGMLCDSRRCQLCKMKASGCSKVMFVIEGARCSKRDSTPDKCSPTKRCQYCKELQQRHGRDIVQETLEQVLYRLQAQHGCFVQYSRSYNETIESLLLMRDILGTATSREEGNTFEVEGDDLALAIALSLGKTPDTVRKKDITKTTLTYEQFCTNSRRKPGDDSFSDSRMPDRGSVTEWTDSTFVKQVHDGNVVACCASNFDLSKIDVEISSGTKRTRNSQAREVVNLDESFQAALKDDDDSDADSSVVMFLENAPPKKKMKKSCANQDAVIDIDDSEEEDDDIVVFNESQESVQILNTAKAGRADFDDDDVEVLLEVKPQSSSLPRNSSPKTARPSVTRSHLLLLSGLYEYDMEFCKDLSDVWKSLYCSGKTANSKDDDFEASAREQLTRIYQTGTPLVARNTILFWLLFIQLRCGIFVHVLRENNGLNKLKSLWQGSPQSTTIGTTPSTHRANARAKITVAPRSASTTFRGDAICPEARSRPTGKPPRKTVPPSNSSLNKVREARLARFEQRTTPPTTRAACELIPSSCRDTPSTQQGWDCTRCTLHNISHASCCVTCGADRPGRTRWMCKRCTLENAPDVSTCVACCAPKLDDPGGCSDIRGPILSAGKVGPARRGSLVEASPVVTTSSAATMQTSQTSQSSKTKCGACGQPGHNRGTATPENCSSYYDEDEVKRRAKKKEENKRKAQQASDNIAQIEQNNADVARQLQEAQRALANLEASATATAALRQNEVKRLKRLEARAKKQAQKYN